jgi:hypothetical protein
LLNHVTQAEDACELSNHHHGELLPSIELPILPCAPETFAFDPVENMLINKWEQLAEDCATICYGLILL